MKAAGSISAASTRTRRLPTNDTVCIVTRETPSRKGDRFRAAFGIGAAASYPEMLLLRVVEARVPSSGN